ncbi:MAG TPA: hypothetical protein VEQ60_06375 [Longimicrobium sp.]|nr:hypothetical protein [Longimicrobium sp.]
MTTQLQRQRIRPMWRAGLRRGRKRIGATIAFEQCPEMKARLMKVIAEMDAMGLDPMPMDHVRQPFDYDRR